MNKCLSETLMQNVNLIVAKTFRNDGKIISNDTLFISTTTQQQFDWHAPLIFHGSNSQVSLFICGNHRNHTKENNAVDNFNC